MCLGLFGERNSELQVIILQEQKCKLGAKI
jgi:hypothetical protein